MKNKVLINTILFTCISILIGVTYYYISSNNIIITLEYNKKNDISNFGNYAKKDKQTVFYIDEEENNVSSNVVYFENKRINTNSNEENIFNNISNTTEIIIENSDNKNYDNENVNKNEENVNKKNESNENIFDEEININKLNKNLNNVLHKKVNGKDITIEDVSNGNCAQAIEYYYKDYYFNCIKSQNIIVTVNNNKYTIKEALNNNIVTMDELIEAGFKPQTDAVDR